MRIIYRSNFSLNRLSYIVKLIFSLRSGRGLVRKCAHQTVEDIRVDVNHGEDPDPAKHGDAKRN